MTGSGAKTVRLLGAYSLIFLFIVVACTCNRCHSAESNQGRLFVSAGQEKIKTQVNKPKPRTTFKPTPQTTVCTQTTTPSALQEAVDNSRPGDIICVTDGVRDSGLDLNKSGTREKPITIKAINKSKVQLVPNSGTYDRVTFNGEWWILDGFEIKEGYDGAKFYAGNNIIRNCWIHNSASQGILTVAGDNITIENNLIENNGKSPNECYDGDNPKKHCHGIYISNSLACGTGNNVVIRGNTIKGHTGRGIQFNGEKCADSMKSALIEYNVIENNSWGMVLFLGLTESIIRNNTVILNYYPPTDDSEHLFIGFYESGNNVIENNTFTSVLSDMYPVLVAGRVSTTQAFVKGNVWDVPSGVLFYWDGDYFPWSNYKKITGWD